MEKSHEMYKQNIINNPNNMLEKYNGKDAVENLLFDFEI